MSKTKLHIINPVSDEEIISQEVVKIQIGLVDISDIHFWKHNPRVYSKVKKKLDSPDNESKNERDIISETLNNTSDLNKLKTRIKNDGQINEPVYICKDISGNTNDYIVYEGNSRLAVAIELTNNGIPFKGKRPWDRIKAKVLPDNTKPETIRKLIGDAHMLGKNPWAVFEKAGFIYRAVKSETGAEGGIIKAVEKVSTDFGEPKSKVRKDYDVMDFMIKNKMTPVAQESQVSYWLAFLDKTKKIRPLFNNFSFLQDQKKIKNPENNAFDKAILKEINYYLDTPLDDGGAAVGFRKDLSLVAGTLKNQKDSDLIAEVINGTTRLSDAAILAKEGGGGLQELERVQKFRDWIIRTDTIKKLEKASKSFPELKRNLEGIRLHSEMVLKDLNTLRKKEKKKKNNVR